MNHPTSAVRFSLIAEIFFLVLLSGCLSSRETASEANNSTDGLRRTPWAGALRALDPADASTPAHDLTAVYLHQHEGNLQIRIDLLDFHSPNDLLLNIRIEDESAPDVFPFEIHIPSESDSTRITLDPQLATVIIEAPLSEIPSRPHINVTTPEDEITGLTLNGPVPTQRAPLLLTFYDTFAGRFPAEALRSWDGAHTGPRGERHGLKHLLDAVEEYQIPIVLLDMKESANLSALDAMGALPRIKALAEEGLLILPNVSPNASGLEQQIVESFGFTTSPFLYNPYPDPWSKYDYRFTFMDDPSHFYHWFRFPTDNIIYIPLVEANESSHPTPDGPTLEIRRTFLETALNQDKKDLLVISDSLSEATWNSPDMVGPIFSYFASRPYIKILNQKDLLNFSTISGRPGLLHKKSDEIFVKMENFYAVANGHVMDYADFWKENLPEQPELRCDFDIDWDNEGECILADENYLAILDPLGARLTYLFTREEDGLHQLIGPSWQVAVGLSNPSTWDLSAGEAADPGAYPGAFADIDDPFKPYEPAIEGNTITFTALDGTRTKTFELTKTGIKAEYQTQEPVTTQIPLLVDPDTRFTPDWAKKYTQQNAPGEIAWGLEDGPMVRVQFEGEISMRAFTESLSLLSTPEDPDFDYPPGHYIPFPMAVAEITPDDGTFTIQLDYFTITMTHNIKTAARDRL